MVKIIQDLDAHLANLRTSGLRPLCRGGAPSLDDAEAAKRSLIAAINRFENATGHARAKEGLWFGLAPDSRAAPSIATMAIQLLVLSLPTIRNVVHANGDDEELTTPLRSRVTSKVAASLESLLYPRSAATVRDDDPPAVVAQRKRDIKKVMNDACLKANVRTDKGGYPLVGTDGFWVAVRDMLNDGRQWRIIRALYLTAAADVQVRLLALQAADQLHEPDRVIDEEFINIAALSLGGSIVKHEDGSITMGWGSGAQAREVTLRPDHVPIPACEEGVDDEAPVSDTGAGRTGTGTGPPSRAMRASQLHGRWRCEDTIRPRSKKSAPSAAVTRDQMCSLSLVHSVR